MPRTSTSPADVASVHDRYRPMSAIAHVPLLIVTLVAGLAWADEDADWPDLDLESRIAAVSDGELRFVSPEQVAGKHRHLNRITIDATSLDQGWIRLTQCHENIDAVGAAQILFNAERIRDLEVVSTKQIGRAWVEGHSVQMKDIAPGARLCVRGESRAFFALGEGRYRLRNGPYMRRFLDGYYPMQVVLDIAYPEDRLTLVSHQPGAQPGFEIRAERGRVEVAAAFEGRLFTCLDFCEKGHPDCEIAASDCTE